MCARFVNNCRVDTVSTTYLFVERIKIKELSLLYELFDTVECGLYLVVDDNYYI